jgi:hypothetical protein
MPTFEESESSSNVPYGFGNQNPTVRNYPLTFEEGGHTAQMASNLANNRLEVGNSTNLTGSFLWQIIS